MTDPSQQPPKESRKTGMKSIPINPKYFSYRFELVDMAWRAGDIVPCEMNVVQKYVAVKDHSITVNNIEFWGAYFRTLLAHGDLDDAIECINQLPLCCESSLVPAEIKNASADFVLKAEILSTFSDAFLVSLFTTKHGWGEEDFVAGGKISEIEFEYVDDDDDFSQ